MALDQNKYIPVSKYADENSLNPEDLFEKIRDGQYIGQLINNVWHIYAPDDDNANNSGSSLRLGNELSIPGVDDEYIPLFSKIARVIGF